MQVSCCFSSLRPHFSYGMLPNISFAPTTNRRLWVIDDKSFIVNCASTMAFPTRFNWEAIR